MTSPEEEPIVTSEHQIKFQIEDPLDADGKYARGLPLQGIVDRVFQSVFHKRNELALMELVLAIQQQPDDWWNQEQEELR